MNEVSVAVDDDVKFGTPTSCMILITKELVALR